MANLWMRLRLWRFGLPSRRKPRTVAAPVTDCTSEEFQFDQWANAGLTEQQIDQMESDWQLPKLPFPEEALLEVEGTDNWLIVTADGRRELRRCTATELELEGLVFVGGQRWDERRDA